MVSTSISLGSSGELCNLFIGWVDIVLLKVSLNSNGELFLGDLSITVGVDLFENSVRLTHGDTWFIFGGDLDGSGGGNDGDEGEFHLFCCFIIYLYLINFFGLNMN